ncbi:formylglycine-generating enzyme family protein [Bacteroidota bacterium]
MGNRNQNRLSNIFLIIITLSLIQNCSRDPVQSFNDYSFEPDWIDVTAGSFTWGEHDETKMIDYDYKIMTYEVTNQQYVDYLNKVIDEELVTINEGKIEGLYSDDYITEDTYVYYDLEGDTADYNVGLIKWNGTNFETQDRYKDHPVVFITFYGASAFAEYHNLRLPTEEEWEKACRGNTGWEYSWGDSINSARANFAHSNDPFEPGTTPVGFYSGNLYENFQTINSHSPYGVYDMTGNVHEWTDSHNTFPLYNRIIRGGSWVFDTVILELWLRSWFRHNHSPGYKCPYIGFRCISTD